MRTILLDRWEEGQPCAEYLGNFEHLEHITTGACVLSLYLLGAAALGVGFGLMGTIAKSYTLLVCGWPGQGF
eukprot:12425562-Karenia_brevis.AAC.1